MHLAIGTRELCGGVLLAAGVLVGSLIGCQALTGPPGERSGTVTTAVALGPGEGLARGGNEVQLLSNGPAAEQAVLAAVALARDHIHLDTFAFADDVAGQRLARALMARQARGVSVHVLRDAVGTLDTPVSFFDNLSAAGVQVQVSHPPPGGVRYHRKLLVVDGQTAFVSGTATLDGRTRQVGGARDTDLRLSGPVVADLQRLFLASWAAQSGPPLPARQHFPAPATHGSQTVSVIASHPDDDPHRVQALLLTAITDARRSVVLGNARFLADGDLLDALEAAARRGVAVHLVLPGHGDSWLRLQAGRSQYARLLRAGVRIHERRGAILHARTVLVDGAWALLGASDLDWAAASRHHELHTVVSGRDFGARLQALFDQDMAASDEIDPVDWADRANDQRLREVFGRAWAWWN